MAIFRKLQVSYWADKFIVRLTPEEKYFYVYLLTNSHTSCSGIYELPRRVIEFETGYNSDTVLKLLQKFIDSDRVSYCEETEEVFIHNWLRYNSANSPKIVAKIREELQFIKCPDYIYSFATLWQRYGYDINTLGIPSARVDGDGDGDGDGEKERDGDRERDRDREEPAPPQKYSAPAGYDPTPQSRDAVVELIKKVETFFGVYPFTPGQIGDGRAEKTKQELASILRLLTVDEILGIIKREYELERKKSKGADLPWNIPYYMKPIKDCFYAADRAIELEERAREKQKRQREKPSEDIQPIATVIPEVMTPEQRAEMAAKAKAIKERIKGASAS